MRCPKKMTTTMRTKKTRTRTAVAKAHSQLKRTTTTTTMRKKMMIVLHVVPPLSDTESAEDFHNSLAILNPWSLSLYSRCGLAIFGRAPY
jgi:hypothetical protein